MAQGQNQSDAGVSNRGRPSSFSVFLYGSEHRKKSLPVSDIDLLVVCDTNDFPILKMQIQEKILELRPEWRAKRLDIRQVIPDQRRPLKAAAVSALAEVFELSRPPLLGENLLGLCYRPTWDDFLLAVEAQKKYWTKTLLNFSDAENIKKLQSENDLKPLYTMIYAFALYGELAKAPGVFIFDPARLDHALFKNVFQLFRNECGYKWPLDQDRGKLVEALAFEGLRFCRRADGGPIASK